MAFKVIRSNIEIVITPSRIDRLHSHLHWFTFGKIIARIKKVNFLLRHSIILPLPLLMRTLLLLE